MSGCDGGSLPVVNAAANLAVSHAFWNWRTSGNMSGASRAWRSVFASYVLLPAWDSALSIQPMMWPRSFFISRTRGYRVMASSS